MILFIHFIQYTELILSRYGSTPKVKRDSVRHSAGAVSLDELSSNLSDFEVTPVTPKAKATKPPSHTVSEPKHRHAAKHRSTISEAAAGVNDYLKLKFEMDREHLDLVKSEIREKQERKDRMQQLEFAKAALLIEGANEEVRTAANEAILKLLRG